MQEITLQMVCSEIDSAFKAQNYNRVDQLLWEALNQFHELPQLWFYAGNLLFNQGRAAMAVQAFQRCVQLENNALVLANLGAAYRKLNDHENGINTLRTALAANPDYAPALVNLGSMYVNEGKPTEGIPFLERAVGLGSPERGYERGSIWNLALLYLEAGRLGEGFDLYRRGLGDERQVRTYGGKHGIEDPPVLPEKEESTKEKTLIVWGEQGIGDELMFAACLFDAREDFKEVIFECHPRLEWLYRKAFPGMRIYPTRKDDYISWPIEEQIKADYKCPIGDLAARYRRSSEAFEEAWRKWGPFYGYDEAEAESYRTQLKKLAAGRPIVGLATRGGVMQTARSYRTLRIPDADFLFKNTDCLFVSLDYDDMMGFSSYCDEHYGAGRYRWIPSIVQHWDYHHTAALCHACDLVVTVAQSVAHLSAATGAQTRLLAPLRAAWREAPVGNPDRWYLYPGDNTRVYRQAEHGNWQPALQRVIDDIKELK